MSSDQWFAAFQRLHRLDAVGMHVLVPCDGSLRGVPDKHDDGCIPRSPFLPENFGCYYGIVSDVLTNGTASVQLETGTEVRVGYEDLVAFQTRCAFGWRVEGKFRDDSGGEQWFV